MTINMVRGDTRPSLEFNFKKPDGTIQVISGATVQFRIRRKGATAVLLARACTVTDGALGKAQFNWATADWDAGKLDAEGHYQGEPEVTYSDATIGTVFAIVPIYARNQVG